MSSNDQIVNDPTKEESKLHKTVHQLAWGLTLLSICSCLIRNDYNVLLGLLLVIGLNRHYYAKKSYYVKIMIHALVGFCLVDLIWMCVIIPFWTSKSSTKYWEQLRGLHIFGIIFSVLELLVKVAMGYFLMTDFKAENNGDIKKLLTFNYEE